MDVSGPEQAQLLTELEEGYHPKERDSEHGCDHEEGLSTQRSVKEQTVSRTRVTGEIRDPFVDGSDELTLDTWDIFNESVIKTVRKKL